MDCSRAKPPAGDDQRVGDVSGRRSVPAPQASFALNSPQLLLQVLQFMVVEPCEPPAGDAGVKAEGVDRTPVRRVYPELLHEPQA